MATSESTVARIELSRHNAQMVLAESALAGERAVAFYRLVITLTRTAAMVLGGALAGDGNQLDMVRIWIGGAYTLFAAVVWWGFKFRITKAVSPERAERAPMAFNVVDFGFLLYMAIRSYQLGEGPHLERSAISFATVLCFSVARYGWRNVLQGTIFAVGCYLALVVFVRAPGAPVDGLSLGFVLVNFICLGLLINWANGLMLHRFLELRKRDNLSSFLPKQVADRLLKDGLVALQPVQREVTVLFVDIRDFTALSESLPPRDVLQFLDGFFGHLSQIVNGREGIVNKFLGDGMLAFWGVPERDEQHAEKALMAMLDIRKQLVEINAQRSRDGLALIRIGMGAHSGTVAAGMLGGADQHEYTIIGDAVNVASRVEGLTKDHAVDALVSEATWSLVHGRFRGARIGEDKVKGRQEKVVVYSLAERVVADAPSSAVNA